MARDAVDLTPLENRDALVDWIEKGEKRHGGPLKVGTEHEKFLFYTRDNTPVPYGGDSGVGAVLEGLKTASGWDGIHDGPHLIGLAHDDGGAAVSLEPGGQFELSGAPLVSLHDTRDELEQHFALVRKVIAPMGMDALLLGMSPLWTRAQTPVMPKSRYRIMMNYMPKVGGLGLDMMLRTSTVQANLDFTSEADMVKKMRVALSLQPLTTALFANSPFTDGKLNGFKSMRSAIWLDTDRDRTGMLPFVFESGFSYERYVDYALDVPLYFVKRGETYHDVAGASFRDLMAGNLRQLPGERAVLSDWVNHLGTIFPEVRLKRYMEMRGADVGSAAMILALPALFVGLLYDGAVLDEAWDLVKGWSNEDRETLHRDVPRLGLKAVVKGRSLQDLATIVLDMAEHGLKERALSDKAGIGEAAYLAPLRRIAETGESHADTLIAAYQGQWRQSVTPVFRQDVMG